MVSLTWLALTSKLAERVNKSSHGRLQKFSGEGCNVDILLIVFRFMTLQCKWVLTRRFTVLHHKGNAPWKHVLHSHLFWNLFLVELYTNLPQRCRLLYVIRYRFCWIGTYSHNRVWNRPETSLKTFAVISLVCAGWTELTSEIFCPNCVLQFAY